MKSKHLTYICMLLVIAGIVFCAVSIVKNKKSSDVFVSGTDAATGTSAADIADPVTLLDPVTTAQGEATTLVSPAADVTLPGENTVTTAGTTATVTAATPGTSKVASSAPASTAAPSRQSGASASVKPSTTTAPAKVPSTAAAAGTVSNYEYAYAGFSPKYADLNVPDWTLILVNRDYILPENFVPEKLVPAVEGDPDSKKLDYRVAPHYNEMYLAAKKDGFILSTVSGYRSYNLQKNNFENKINKFMNNNGWNRTKATQEAARIILPPGTSEHNLGFAMDICSLEQSFEKTDEFAWLMNNAEKYGFILRYPENKQDVTKIIYEPWHWRYVGPENAKLINQSHKCLEEFLDKA